jgi:hypothetical protein
MSSKTLRVFTQKKGFQGCSGCPFAKEDGSPCDRERFEVKVKTRGSQFLGAAKIWNTGESFYGTAVIVDGVVYCIKAFSRLIRGHYSFVDLDIVHSVKLVLDQLPKNRRRKTIMLKQRGLYR